MERQAVEVTLVLRFEDSALVPDDNEVEYAFDCIVIERSEEEV